MVLPESYNHFQKYSWRSPWMYVDFIPLSFPNLHPVSLLYPLQTSLHLPHLTPLAPPPQFHPSVYWRTYNKDSNILRKHHYFTKLCNLPQWHHVGRQWLSFMDINRLKFRQVFYSEIDTKIIISDGKSTNGHHTSSRLANLSLQDYQFSETWLFLFYTNTRQRSMSYLLLCVFHQISSFSGEG